MKITYIVAVALLTGSLNNYCFSQSDIPSAKWMTVKVDGHDGEWSDPLRFYDPSAKLSYSVANDSNNLYLCFQSNDEMNQVKIMRAGMIIKLTTKGKEKRTATITFPLGQADQGSPRSVNEVPDNKPAGGFKENRKNTFLLQNTLMDVKGFASKSGLISIKDSSGINTAINWDSNNKLVYEVSIPFRELFALNFTLADIDKPVTLSVEVNPLRREERPSSQGQGGWQGSGRSGGHNGGNGMHRGGGRGMNPDRQADDMTSADRVSLSEKGKLTLKFVLSKG